MHQTLQFLPRFYQQVDTVVGRLRINVRCSSGEQTTFGNLTDRKRFYIRNKNTGYLFLVDSGAQVCVVLVKLNMLTNETAFTLQAANGSRINTYGETSLTLNLGIRRSFPWVFTIAQVKTPILGAHILAHFNLSVNMSTHSLDDKTTKLKKKRITSIYTQTGISSTFPAANGLHDLLRKYPDISIVGYQLQ